MRKLFYTKFLVFAFVLCPSFSMYSNLIYVSPSQSINKAIQSAADGDTVVLKNGRYYQTINIEKSLVLKAENPGRAIIDGGINKKFRWIRIEDEWVAKIPWNPEHIVMDDYSFIRMGTALKNFTADGKFLGGFYYDEGSVFLRPGTDIDPNTAQVSVQRQDAGVGITVCANNVTIDGLRIQCHAWTGIKIDDDFNNCTVSNCFIIGSRQGIAQEPFKGSGHLIEFNEITNYPLYQRSKHANTNELWRTIYRNKPAYGNNDGIFDSETTAVMLGSKSTTIRYNIISEMMDGLQPRKQGVTAKHEKIECYNNLIYNHRDDAVEFDSNDPLRMRFHHNVIINAYVQIAPSTVMIGPVMIDHNLILATPYNDGGLANSAVMFKFDAKTSWTDGFARRTRIIHNTVVSTNPATRLWWTQPENGQFECMIANNIIDIQHQELASFFPFPEVKNFRSNEVNFYNKEEKWDLRLSLDSKAINYGDIENSDYHVFSDGKPDAGAIEYGRDWSFPLIGPSWKIEIASPLPSVINLSMVGLNKHK